MLDADTLRARLSEWLPPRVGASTVTITHLTPPSGTGYSSETLLFTAQFTSDGGEQTQKYVARLKPTRQGVFPEYDIDLQHDVMATLARTSTIPVPQMLWQEHDTNVLGAEFFVMGHVEGRVPSDNPPYTLGGWIIDEPEDRRRIMHTSAHAVLCDIAMLDPDVALGDTITKKLRHGLDDELAYYESFFENAARGRPQPVAERAWEWVHANKPSARPLGLSWGDSRISNMIFGADMRPAAVLDWEMVSLGDPEMDLGWWLFLDRHFTFGMGVEQPAGFMTRDETIARWEERVGRAATNVDFYEMLAGFKFAVIMMSLTRLFIADGLMPADTDFDRNNTVTQCLAPMLGMPSPAAD